MAIMVSDALIYHPAVSHYLRYVATTSGFSIGIKALLTRVVGRDKVLRTLQYFSRFYAWYLSRKASSAAAISPFVAIKTQFGLTRKIMRIGKFVEHFKQASELFDTAGTRGGNSDLLLQYLGVLRQLGYGFYMSFDLLTVLDAAGIKKSAAAKRFQARAYRAWLFGLLASAVSGVYLNYKLTRKASTIDEKDGEAKLEAKKIAR